MLKMCIKPKTIEDNIIDKIIFFLLFENLSRNSFNNQPRHKNSSTTPINKQYVARLRIVGILNSEPLIIITTIFNIKYIAAINNNGHPNFNPVDVFSFSSLKI